jgi:DUF1680 family protein
MAANPRVDPTRGSLAVQRGPVVYCFEEADQDTAVDLDDVAIDPATPLRTEWRDDLLGGVMAVEAAGSTVDTSGWGDQLYLPLDAYRSSDFNRYLGHPITLVGIPYYAWANRGAGKMRVWIPYLLK